MVKGDIMDLPNKKYRVIYADPPWYTPNVTGDKVIISPIAATRYFSVMKTRNIIELPVSQICEDVAVLFLWSICSQLSNAINVMEAWGFKFVNVAFCWVKLSTRDNLIANYGRWTMTGTELCLLGRKGKIKPVKQGIKQVLIQQREKFARKPDEVRNRIDAMMGDCSKIELFARERFEGWDAWGNEV